MQRIGVFCGSSMGLNPAYATAARQLGRTMAGRNLALVYGGGGTGLMGVLADATLDAGGAVIGVIPQALMARELGHARLTELRVVNSMHDRKAVMADLSDGFIMLPGGAGTLDEFCEIWTWAQLGIHQKPCGILNIEGYYDPLLVFLDQMVDKAFLSPEHRAMVLVGRQPKTLLDRFIGYRAPQGPRWIDPTQT